MTAVLTAIVAEGRVQDDADPRPVPWWSFTKTVLAAAALVLVAEERLALDNALPGEAFTLRQVLQHRAGLACYGWLRAYHQAVARRDTPWTAQDMRARVGQAPGTPGARFAYSNVGYAMVRSLIETETGLELDSALQSLVLAPLGIGGVIIARTPADLAVTAWGNTAGYDPDWVYHGLLIGPVGAAALLLDRLMTGALLAPDLLDAMRSALPVGDAPPPGRPWPEPGYGLGLMAGTGEPPIRFEGHTGGGPGSRIAVYHAPSTGRTACVAAPIEDEAVVERRALELAAIAQRACVGAVSG